MHPSYLCLKAVGPIQAVAWTSHHGRIPMRFPGKPPEQKGQRYQCVARLLTDWQAERPVTNALIDGEPRIGKPRSGKPRSGKPRSRKPRNGQPWSRKSGSGKPRSRKSRSGKPGCGAPVRIPPTQWDMAKQMGLNKQPGE